MGKLYTIHRTNTICRTNSVRLFVKVISMSNAEGVMRAVSDLMPNLIIVIAFIGNGY